MSDISPVKIRAKKYAGVYLAIILFIISFGGGVIVGKTWYVKKQITDENGNVQIEKVLNLNRSINHSNLDFSQFWDVWDKIQAKYVKKPSKDTDMFYGAIQGLVASLGDPYSLYFPPKAAEEFAKDLSGELEGIGAEIGVKNNQLVVVSPLPDSPAEKVGLKPGDKILEIDKESTFGMDVNTAVTKIRGKASTKVVLTITRDGLTKSSEVTIVRSKINVPSVLFSVKPGNIAYLRIMQFSGDTTNQLNKYIKQIKAKGNKAIILDLRNNPGGYLDAAIEMASDWVTSGVVVSEKGRDGQSNEHETQGSHPLSGIKTIVLVNKGSASASEIVAGALQDTKNAILIGEQTFGKGSVQDFETFPDGSALKLTVAEWFTPNGKNINKEGIKPDIEVKEDWDKEKIGEDVVLSKALELIASSTVK
ncbi:MAG TPA: S41 family peptidase [Candidatus Udaeobacter sp.]|nr:S41 family peptidase [Candidatus Udaeobacter sp.]